MWTCSECGFKNENSDRFCGGCGRQKPAEKSVKLKSGSCANCGASLAGADTFCPGCGKRIEGKAPGAGKKPNPKKVPAPGKKKKTNKNAGLWVLVAAALAVAIFAGVLAVMDMMKYTVSFDLGYDSSGRPPETQTVKRNGTAEKPAGPHTQGLYLLCCAYSNNGRENSSGKAGQAEYQMVRAREAARQLQAQNKQRN